MITSASFVYKSLALASSTAFSYEEKTPKNTYVLLVLCISDWNNTYTLVCSNVYS